MKLFTVGPVEMYPETLKIEGTQLPYFRTAEFSEIMKESEKMFLQSVNAPSGSRFIGLTSSGTGAMDAAVVNTLSKKDKALVINGGSFGARFAEICRGYGIETETYDIPFMSAFDKGSFEAFVAEANRLGNDEAILDGHEAEPQSGLDENGSNGFTALLVNACETSTGQLYDLKYLGDFCRKNNMFFIVDAVSAYLADSIDMSVCNIDVLITASQKALALSPGAAYVALSERTVKRIMCDEDSKDTAKHAQSYDNTEIDSVIQKEDRIVSYYLDFKNYILDQRRGQPPYTSAVGIMLAFHERMKSIMEAEKCNDKTGSSMSGVDTELAKHRERAEYFREKIKELPVEIPDIPLSNCVTPVIFPKENAWEVFEYLKDNYELILTPSGGAWRDKQLRVGHLGNLELHDYDVLIDKLREFLCSN